MGDGGNAVVDGAAEFVAAGAAGGFDVAEAEADVGVGFVDGDAEECVSVVDADLGDVAGVVADGDGVPDERGEGGREVALTLEVDSVSLHGPMRGRGEQQAVELVEGVGHAGHPPVRDPRISRGDTELLVGALIVGGDEGADRPVHAREIEHGLRAAVPGAEVAGEGREDFGVDGAEKALDLASPLRPADGGEDEPEVQLDGGALEVVAGEVGAVIDVQHVGDPAHRPRGVGLPPDRLPQRESGVQ